MKDIRFYRVGDEHGNFSNFASFPIFLDGSSWPTVEHYFQSNKFIDVKVINKIKSLPSPMQAAQEGRNENNSLRVDWEMIKDDIMLKALTAKFTQHPSLRKELLLTGEKSIIEHTTNDSYWGNGGDDKGKNMLGHLLMEVREVLKEIDDDPEVVLPPWVAFPELDQNDMFWRMGLGENYMYTWSRFYMALDNKSNYLLLFPEPNTWQGFFD